MKKRLLAVMALGAACLTGQVAWADPIVLTFEGIGNQVPVDNYYNGGPGGALGITFSSNAIGDVNGLNGGTGDFFGNPSGITVLVFDNGGGNSPNPGIIDDAAGFTTGFSFYYAAPIYPGAVAVYSGLDGTGTKLGGFTLDYTPIVDQILDYYGPFMPFGAPFSGTAESIVFTGFFSLGFLSLDNVTFGSATPGTTTVPEPGSLALLAAGLAGLGTILRRRNV